MKMSYGHVVKISCVGGLLSKTTTEVNGNDPQFKRVDHWFTNMKISNFQIEQEKNRLIPYYIKFVTVSSASRYDKRGLPNKQVHIFT